MGDKNLVIMSLGQLVKADASRSIKAFTTLSCKYSTLPYFIAYPLHYVRTSLIYLWDMYVGGNIEDYKVGKKTDNQFMSFLRSRFAGTDDELKAEWNAMCVIDEKSKADVAALKEFIGNADNNVSLLLVSVTNRIQHEFVMQQLGSFDSATVVTSFEHKTNVYNDLASIGVKKVPGFKDKTDIYSLHNKVTKIADEEVKANFHSGAFNPFAERLKDKLGSLGIA